MSNKNQVLTLIYKTQFLSSNRQTGEKYPRFVYTVIGPEAAIKKYLEDSDHIRGTDRFMNGGKDTETGDPIYYSRDNTLHGSNIVRNDSKGYWAVDNQEADLLDSFRAKFPNLTTEDLLYVMDKQEKQAAAALKKYFKDPEKVKSSDDDEDLEK